MNASDLDAWLEARGIDRRCADEIAQDIAQRYPILTKAIKLYHDVEGELELVLLVYSLRNSTEKTANPLA